MSVLPPAVVPPRESVPLVLTSTNLCRLYTPGRGIASSLLIHGIVFTVLQLLSVVNSPAERIRLEPGAPGPGSGVRFVMFLPSMGGGGKGKGGGSESSGNGAPSAPSAPSAGADGLVFPGPQVIRSDSPLPNGGLQTLLQPGLEDLPVLEEPVDLPNFISMPEVPDVVQPAEPSPAESPPEVAAEPARPALEDLPLLEPRLDVPDPVKVAEQQFVEPPRVAAETEQRPLEDLPILKPRPDVPVLLSTPEVGFVLPSAPEQAVGLPDTVKPEEPEPVELSQGVVTEPVQEELEDLPFLTERSDTPNLLTASNLPDIVEPEEEPPVDLAEEEETKPVPRPVEDLPTLKPRLDSPNLLAASNLPDIVKFEEEPPVDLAREVETEPVPRPVEDLPTLKPRLDSPNLLSTSSLPDTAKLEEQPPVEDLPMVKLRLDLPRTDLPMILALTPRPTSAELPEEVPAAQARGSFTISPEPKLDTSETEPGSPSAIETEDETVGLTVGNSLSASVVNISFGEGEGGGEGLESEGSSSSGGGDIGPGSGPGSGPGPGVGSGSGSGAGSGPGTGLFEGITIVGGAGEIGPIGWGTGSGSGTGSLGGITILGGVGGTGTSGSGTGPDSGQASLAGISIVGGVDGSHTPPNSVSITRVPNPLPARYGALSVVSTESSGGGLPYFGVFLDEQIRTVYLDMRQGKTEEAPLWTLEFGVPGNTAVRTNPPPQLDEGQQSDEIQPEDESQPGDESQPEGESQQEEQGRQGDENRQEEESQEGEESQEEDETQPEFILPVPIVKERPVLPFELDQRHIGRMIIVYAVINVEGKMEQMWVMESPDPLLNQAVLDALREWVFQPGQLNGAPVAVKALLGMPLWAPGPPASSLILPGSIPSNSP